MPAPPRLQTIATETAARMHVSFRKVWLLRSSLAQAYADIRKRDLLFTERLLEILSDEEVAAICAHELGHLSEPKTEYFKRWFLAASMWPWVFLKPLVHTFGMPAYFGLVGLTAGVQVLRYQVSHKLEVRADRIAKDSVAESAVYARALLRLYEDNQSPAVTSQREKTHPDLYDRMLAAGVTPDFPRPAAPERRAWHSRALGTIFWLLLGILILRMVGEANESPPADPGSQGSNRVPWAQQCQDSRNNGVHCTPVNSIVAAAEDSRIPHSSFLHPRRTLHFLPAANLTQLLQPHLGGK